MLASEAVDRANWTSQILDQYPPVRGNPSSTVLKEGSSGRADQGQQHPKIQWGQLEAAQFVDEYAKHQVAIQLNPLTGQPHVSEQGRIDGAETVELIALLEQQRYGREGQGRIGQGRNQRRRRGGVDRQEAEDSSVGRSS